MFQSTTIYWIIFTFIYWRKISVKNGLRSSERINVSEEGRKEDTNTT